MDERDSRLSEAYRDADHPAPSPALDAAILAAARAALARPARRRATWLKWGVPLSTTAVLVLGISLLFKIQRESPEAMRDALPAPAASPRQSAPMVPARVQEGESDKPAPAKKTVTEAASPPAAKPRAMPQPELGSVPDGALPAAELASQPQPQPQPFPAWSVVVPATPPVTLPPTPPTSPPIADAPESPREAPPVPSVSGQTSERAVRREIAKPAAAFDSAIKQQTRARKSDAAKTLDPEEWVELIRVLQRKGHAEKARVLLEALRKSHPDFVLPEDLQALADPDNPAHSGKAP